MFTKNSFLKSLTFAFQGIKHCVISEPHIRFELTAGALAILIGWYCKISPLEWLCLLLTITIVLVAEMINTALENVCDLITSEYNPLINVVKNVAAGAVLIAALMLS